MLFSRYFEAALRRCSNKKVFWKYAANLQDNTQPKRDFNKAAKQLYLNHISPWAFSGKFAAYFKNGFI